MEKQTFENHVRVHPLYHYGLVPFTLLLIVAAGVNIAFAFSWEAAIILVLAILLHIVVFLAGDYAKKDQDRIIRIELRLRYYQLTQQRLEDIESRFTFGQLAALRFASDEELLEFVRDPATSTLKPDEIKRRIVLWNPDLMRV